MESDPIGLEGGVNSYVYTLNNPIVNMDLLGKDIWIEGGVHSFMCVGTSENSYCSGFGAKDGDLWDQTKCVVNTCDGIIYEDFSEGEGGYRFRSRSSTTEQDKVIRNFLKGYEDRDLLYSIFFYNCHSYSTMMYEYVEDNFL